MSERKDMDLARRACIAINLVTLRRDQALLEKRRRAHGSTLKIIRRMERVTNRQLFLESGGDPFCDIHTKDVDPVHDRLRMEVAGG